MSNAIIVAEGKLDIILLKKYLPQLEDASLRWFAAQGKMSLTTLARNILVHEGGPVLIVADADTLKRQRMEEDRSMMLAVLGNVAGSEAFDVFCYMPEHEVIFFEAPGVLQRYFPETYGENVEIGKLDAKNTLESLLKGRHESLVDWYAKLTPQDGELLRQGVQAKQLLAKLEELLVLPEIEYA
ncbi:MAG: hypothetical protein EPN21_06025 [Methylococcaceae bacterium]|nr:MAG: hypothetical protein EPN21_06025 [Methylococcaceae bacterium]